ncbi:MAG: bifunctional methylenetetrahydrofolate dehydrogenase/methenyltetrahydrofolate cyclohydrolase FolD [Alphaproteobacteria bacterium]
MSATVIDGKGFAAGLRAGIAAAARATGLTPGLAVVLIGDDPASAVYVRNKKAACAEAGFASFDIDLPASVTQAVLLEQIARLNADKKVHGILVQLPLPKHIDAQSVIDAIDPAKDVDGFHVINAGKLAVGQKGLVPCTPLGCLLLLKDYYAKTGGTLEGKHAVVLGRSNIVGKPMALLLLRESCTVTICHSKTEYLVGELRRGDILVAAIGRPEFVKGHMLKPGAVVLDVGINRIERDGRSILVGDVDYAQAVAHTPEMPGAAAITPVPGGVGPMTIACLLRNTLQAACAIEGVAFPLA